MKRRDRLVACPRVGPGNRLKLERHEAAVPDENGIEDSRDEQPHRGRDALCDGPGHTAVERIPR